MVKFENDAKWNQLFDESHKVLMGYLKGDSQTEQQRQRVKVAVSVMSGYTRHEATESAKQQTAVVIARELASNKTEFAEYLKLSLPRVQLMEQTKGNK